jgi:sulfopropanediol 3-dehydrogenase
LILVIFAAMAATAAALAHAPSAKMLKTAPVGTPANGEWYPGAGSEEKTSKLVAEMLTVIRTGGADECLKYAQKLDKWPADKPVLLSKEDIEAITSVLPQKVKDDTHFQHARVKAFAQKSRDSMHEFQYEVSPGCTLGQRLVPVSTVGCYVPGGRYCHISSAIMSVTTAKVAGVKNVVACSPPMPGTIDMHPATVYAMHVAGADHILCMGGVQAVAAMAYGFLTTAGPADMIVGPGNAFVAESKRQLFGRIGIDMFAGPTEIMVLADESADPFIVASDLVSQAEHGLNSPAWLLTTSEKLGKDVLVEVDKALTKLEVVEPNNPARVAWRDYGEITLLANREEMVALSDFYSAEHLEVQCKDLDWYLATLRNYGSLFLGEETCVTYGDKCSGTNHILPTKSVSRYSGGLSVDKFIKKLTWQRMTREANHEVGSAAARISRLEGMEGHARAGDDRLAKYFPSETFELDSQWKRPKLA